ncbi:MAG TPA: DUF5995 family protein [Hanamia sp.]
MNQAGTIEEVISQLDDIIAWSISNKSRMGYFATLYRRMTVAVQQGIINNIFQDGKRMEQLDVDFANRYFFAWNAYTNNQPCSLAWKVAFDACQNSELICLQHLILGINTHINLDLCMATAACCPGDKIYDLESDFNKINDVIAAQAQLVQDTLCKVWFPLKVLKDIANNEEDAVINFSIGTARTCSWANAVALAHTNAQMTAELTSQIDNTVVALGNKVIDPGLWINLILKPVLFMESKDVDNIIELLKD